MSLFDDAKLGIFLEDAIDGEEFLHDRSEIISQRGLREGLRDGVKAFFFPRKETGCNPSLHRGEGFF